MTTTLKFFPNKSNKVDENYLPPHYDDLSIKSGYLPSYEETFTSSDIPLYSKLISTLYQMGPKSYVVVDPTVYDLEKLSIELAINNDTKLTLFKFYLDDTTDTTKISIDINNDTIITTKDLVLLGFSDIDIKFDGIQNMKENCTVYSFQIVDGKYIGSCLHYKWSILLKTNKSFS
jgi:hypothetical protein